MLLEKIVLQKILDECGSTNEELKKLALSKTDELASGSWLMAHRQVSGRGRMGRVWESLEGNLFLSVLLRPKRMEILTWIPLASSVAVVKILKQELSNANQSLELKIKWPNDIYLNDGKLGGILCESQGTGGGGTSVIVGIGLNLKHAPKIDGVEIRNLDGSISPESIASKIARQILEELTHLETHGPDTLREYYNQQAWLTPGTTIVWKDDRETGTVVGLGSNGELKVQKKDGPVQPLYSEEVKVRKAF